MKKKKIKKKVKILLVIFLIIFVIGSITIKQNKSNQSPQEYTTKIDKKNKKSPLTTLNYSKDDIALIEKYNISDENIKYLIDNKIDSKLAMNIIKEKYYIDDYLKKYLDYYEKNKDLSFSEIITRINTHLDDEFYTNTEKTDDTLGKFVILNKHYYSDENYKGLNLIDVDSEYNLYNTTFKLSKECYEAFLKMYNDAKEQGYAFKINSAYRSYEKQIKIYQGWVNKDGVKLADTYSARAGFSEHQTGYAFDVRDYPFTNDDYSKTKSFTWVSENAYKYGFIIRFPKDKEYITGYQYEPWHYRYCGIECATYIHNNNITFEEYYEYFIKYNNPRNL